MAADEARKRSFVDLEFESRLAAARLELMSGDTTAGRHDLAKLAHDASARGFLLLARRAEKAGKSYVR